MAYVIAEPCIGQKDNSCVEVCPVDCIHPTPDEPDYDNVEQLYIDPEECIDCDACVEACPVDACFTPRRLDAAEDMVLLRYGLGVTNLVDRPTRAASELSAGELRAGAMALEARVRELAPRLVAVVGMGAWRTAFDRPRATFGLQPETVGGRLAWVLPNPSGLNAHHQLPELARLYAQAREYADEL